MRKIHHLYLSRDDCPIPTNQNDDFSLASHIHGVRPIRPGNSKLSRSLQVGKMVKLFAAAFKVLRTS